MIFLPELFSSFAFSRKCGAFFFFKLGRDTDSSAAVEGTLDVGIYLNTYTALGQKSRVEPAVSGVHPVPVRANQDKTKNDEMRPLFLRLRTIMASSSLLANHHHFQIPLKIDFGLVRVSSSQQQIPLTRSSIPLSSSLCHRRPSCARPTQQEDFYTSG